MTSRGSHAFIRVHHSLGIIFLLSISILFNAKAQQKDAATLVSESLTRAIHHYDNYLGQNLRLYSGPQYTFNYGQVGGHQYFIDDYWEQGSIVFEGQVYDGIFMKYDLLNDLITVEHFGDKGLLMSIKLFSPLVSSFTLHNHFFVRLHADSAGVIKEGFYDMLFDGDNISVLAKRQKEKVRTTGAGTLSDDFVEKDRHYMVKNGVYYPVKKRGSVIKVLADQKKQVKHFVRTNRLYFSTDRDRDLKIIGQYYESIFQ